MAPAVVGIRGQLPAATEPVQLSVPSLTVTLPVGVPLPGATAVTVKFTGTGCPTTDGSGRSEVIAVVVLALFTTWFTWLEVLLTKVSSPP